MVAEDRLGYPELAVDVERLGRPLDVALLVVKDDRAISGALRDAVERVDEVQVPQGSAELAVRHPAKADLLLHANDVADRLVLDGTKLGRVDRAGRGVVSSSQELGRTEQASDVIGPERWSVAHGHGRSLPQTRARPT